MSNKLTFLILTLITFLSVGCNLKPLYSEQEGALPVKIGNISFSENPSKLNLIFNNSLEKALNPEGNNISPKYSLDVKLIKSSLSFAIQNNSVNNRTRIDLVADYTLIKLATNKIIVQDKAIAVDSFEITQSPYSNLISEEEVMNILARNLSNEIKLRLSNAIYSDNESDNN